jgi:hypothetical protein
MRSRFAALRLRVARRDYWSIFTSKAFFLML